MTAYRALGLAAMLALTGCQTTHSLKGAQPDYDQEPMPTLYVMAQGNVSGALVRNKIRASGMFQRIEDGQAPADGYTVQVSTHSNLNDFQNYPLFLLSALTVFVLPVPQELDSQFEFKVLRGEVPLKTYSYHNQSKYFLSILNLGDKSKDEHLRYLIGSFVSELQRDRLLEKPKSTSFEQTQ